MLDLLSFIAENLLLFALHLAGSSFPKPLDFREEQRCFAEMKAGDRAARDKLVNHNLRLVAHIIKKYNTSPCEQEDLISIGTIGLIKAVNTFNSEKGTRLATYAARCIENEILMHFRSAKKTAQDVSLNETIDTDKDGNPLTLMDIMAVDDNILDELDRKLNGRKLGQFIREELTDRERQIIIMRYGLGGREPMTQKKVAKIMNISRSYVSRIETKALKKLKKRYDTSSNLR